MTYNQQAKLEMLNAVNCIQTESELREFRDMLAHYFAKKAEQEIEAMWDQGTINEDTIEQWGKEHMRTPYKYAKNRS